MSGDLCNIYVNEADRKLYCDTCGDEWNRFEPHTCPLGTKYPESDPSRGAAIAIIAGLILLAGGGGLLMGWIVRTFFN